MGKFTNMGRLQKWGSLPKEANNDTLKIVKDDKTYYLLINEEKRW